MLDVENEIDESMKFLASAKRSWCQSVVVNSNHDAMLKDWLRAQSHKKDPLNAELYLRAELFMHQSIRNNPNKEPCLLEWAIRESEVRNGTKRPGKLARFLDEDESFVICKNFGEGVEMGMHGHRGPNGSRGSIYSFAKMGRKSVIGHSHVAGNHEGCLQVGLSGLKDQGYNSGPSSWSHTHALIYPSGKGTLVTIYNGKWRARS